MTPARPLPEILRDARVRADIDEALMGRMIGIEAERVRQLEVGATAISPEDLDAYAQVFGLSIQQFAAGEAAHAPLTHLLFRSRQEGGMPSLQQLIDGGAHRVIGEFLRCTRYVADLQRLLATETVDEDGQRLPRALVPLRVSDDPVPPHGAEELARALREHLGLGLAPIPSLRALLEELGVITFYVTPDEELDRDIDGASTVRPVPAVLVNLVEGPGCWWRTRMTLAHELCHLLVDHPAARMRGAPIAMISPHPRWHLFEGFERMERRANAFAACLLAPAAAVRDRLGTHTDPTSEAAIEQVCQTFGVGRTTAINRLRDVYGFGERIRLAMEQRRHGQQHAPEHADAVSPDRTGLRGGILQHLAIAALAAGRIDRVRVREHLDLPLTEPLPPDPRLTEAQRAPLRRIEDTVRGVAQRYLRDAGAHALVATEIEAGEGGWHVAVERPEGDPSGAYVSAGALVVAYDLRVAHAEVCDGDLNRDQEEPPVAP